MVLENQFVFLVWTESNEHLKSLLSLRTVTYLGRLMEEIPCKRRCLPLCQQREGPTSPILMEQSHPVLGQHQPHTSVLPSLD